MLTMLQSTDFDADFDMDFEPLPHSQACRLWDTVCTVLFPGRCLCKPVVEKIK